MDIEIVRGWLGDLPDGWTVASDINEDLYAVSPDYSVLSILTMGWDHDDEYGPVIKWQFGIKEERKQ